MKLSLPLVIAGAAGATAQNDAGWTSWYTSAYQTICTSSRTTVAVVPCTTPLQWTNTAASPSTATSLITIPVTVPGSSTQISYSTSLLTTTIPAYATVTDYKTYYTSSTVIVYDSYTTWTTSTLFTGMSSL